MIVVDASVFTSVYVQADTHHGPSRQWLRRYVLSGQRLVAPPLLAVEVASAVARRTNDSACGEHALNGLLQLSALRLITINRRLYIAAARLACDLRLRGADAVYVAVAERLGVPLITWDNEHLTRGAQRITVYTPDTALLP